MVVNAMYAWYFAGLGCAAVEEKGVTIALSFFGSVISFPELPLQN
jgi:hypothetical protein